MKTMEGIIINGVMYAPTVNAESPRRQDNCTRCDLRKFCDSEDCGMMPCLVRVDWRGFKKAGEVHSAQSTPWDWERGVARMYGMTICKNDVEWGEVAGVCLIPRDGDVEAEIYTRGNARGFMFKMWELKMLLGGGSLLRTSEGAVYQLKGKEGKK